MSTDELSGFIHQPVVVRPLRADCISKLPKRTKLGGTQHNYRTWLRVG